MTFIGSETATLGPYVLEGPGVCLHPDHDRRSQLRVLRRTPPFWGDGVAVTKAIQAHGVIAMGKHYVVNDQEYERFRTSVEVDEDVLRELSAAVRDVGQGRRNRGDYDAYNRVRGVYATEYRYTLTDILRRVGL